MYKIILFNKTVSDENAQANLINSKTPLSLSSAESLWFKISMQDTKVFLTRKFKFKKKKTANKKQNITIDRDALR